MPADQGGSTGASTVKKPKKTSMGQALGKAAARANGPSSGGSKRKSSSSSRGYSSNSGGGGSSRGYSGGGGGGGGSSYKAPKAPSLAAYLGTDSAYQSAVRGQKRSLSDFLSETGRRRGEANTQFTQTSASMERDRTRQLDELRQEFASRGLIQSGLFGEEQGRFQQQFTDQATALQQQQAALLADILGQENNYRRENELGLEAARQEALARRAAKYKIGA